MKPPTDEQVDRAAITLGVVGAQAKALIENLKVVRGELNRLEREASGIESEERTLGEHRSRERIAEADEVQAAVFNLRHAIHVAATGWTYPG